MSGPQAIFLFVVAASWIGTALVCYRSGRSEGFDLGRKLGQDEQYVDDFIAAGKRRCAKCGQYAKQLFNS